MLLHQEGMAQIKPAVKDSAPATHFTNVSFRDSTANKPTYKYVYSAPKNELMRWPNYPLTSAQIEQRQKLEENRKVLPKVGESVVESWINNKKKKKAAVVPAF
jgi:hypothetical protein